MAEHSNGLEINTLSNTEMSWKLGPRDFIFKYLKYLPWIIICSIIALVLGYLKIRYTTNIYTVTASMLIRDDKKSTTKDPRFDELFMNQGNMNLNNEIQILKSRPVLQRVAHDLGMQITYFNKGKVRASLSYPESPIKLETPKMADPTLGFSLAVTLLNDNKFTLGKSKTEITFGEPFTVGGNTCVLFRNQTFNMKYLSSPDFIIYYAPLNSVASAFLGNLSVVQIDNQATILTLTYQSENIDLGKDILNNLMAVYDSIIVEDKNKIANSTLRFIENRLDTVKQELNNTTGRVKNFTIDNAAYDVKEQSRKFMDGIEESSKNMSEFETKKIGRAHV